MRDYKLRKKVFNDYPNKEEVAEMIEAGGGGSGSGLVVRTNETGDTLDTKWSVINEALRAGRNISAILDAAGNADIVGIIAAATDDGKGAYRTNIIMGDQIITFSTNSSNGYPSYQATT